MNASQFLVRWPAKQSRLFLFGGGKDYDRLTLFYAVCDYWRQKVDNLDYVRLHETSLAEVAEACRADPLMSTHRVVCATEITWLDPTDAEDAEERAKRQRSFDTLHKLTSKMPRDLVLIMSTNHDNPLTKNDLAQSIITKGYWVVLKNVDVATAIGLLQFYTQWEEDLCLEVVESVGTSPAQLLSFLKLLRLFALDPTPDDVRQFLTSFSVTSVFELTDAIVMKNLPRALELAQEEVSLGQLIGSLDRKFTSLVQFIAEMKQGRTPKEAAAYLRLPGFIVHGLYEASKRWSPNEILSLYPTLAEYSAQGPNIGSLELLISDVIGRP